MRCSAASERSAVAAVSAVALAANELAQRLCGGAQDGGAHVVLEAGEGFGQLRGDTSAGRLRGDLADGTLSHGGRGGVDETDTVNNLARGTEGLA